MNSRFEETSLFSIRRFCWINFHSNVIVLVSERSFTLLDYRVSETRASYFQFFEFLRRFHRLRRFSELNFDALFLDAPYNVCEFWVLLRPSLAIKLVSLWILRIWNFLGEIERFSLKARVFATKKIFFFFISFFSSRLHHFVYLSYSMSHTLLDCVFSGFFVFCICLCSMSNLLSFFPFFNTRRCRSEFFGFLLISTQSIFFSVGFRLINALKLITGFYLRLLAHHQV